MKVSEVMTTEIETVRPDQQAREAARFMLQADAGSIPVTEGERLVGMITDRDIAVRGVAKGLQPDARVRDVMTEEVLYCFEDQDSEEVLGNMGDEQIRRLPVVDRNKRLVGVVSISDLAQGGEEARAGEALREIAQPSALHSQTLETERMVS